MNVTTEVLDVTRGVLASRLAYLLRGRGEVAVMGRQLQVSLFDGRDLELAKGATRHVGALVFIDSPNLVDTGATLASSPPPVLVGADVAGAQKGTDDLGYCALRLRLTVEGAHKASTYSTANVGHALSLVRDGRVVFSAVVRDALSDRIVISGLSDEAALHILSAEFHSGPLPTQLTLVGERIPPEAQGRPVGVEGSAPTLASVPLLLSRVVHSIGYDVVGLVAFIVLVVATLRAWRVDRATALRKQGLWTLATIVVFVLPRFVIPSSAEIDRGEVGSAMCRASH
jgi:preprotein translocase subunit SecD